MPFGVLSSVPLPFLTGDFCGSVITSWHSDDPCGLGEKSADGRVASAINNGEERTMTMPTNLTRQQLVDVVNHIRDILWLDVRGSREWLNPDKTWDAETLEMVAGVLEDAGLKPPPTAEDEG
jgi:hypothetical protein